jgi:glycerol-3-phosphate O-acyltransferase 3/4
VTKRFSAEELPTWNLLSRTYKSVKIRSFKLNLLWIFGFVIRFLVLFPIRFIIFISGMLFLIATMAVLGYISDSPLKRRLYHKFSICAYRLLAGSLSSVITYHNKQHKAVNGSVCVANHTSPIDVLMLHCDNAYALVGQAHGGFLGTFFKVASFAFPFVLITIGICFWIQVSCKKL